MKAKIKNIICIAITLSLSPFLFTCCDSADEFESNKRVSVKIDLGGELTQCIPNCVLVDENNPSNRYIRIDSIIGFGLGMEYLLPDSLKDCDLKIIATGKMRNNGGLKGSIAFSLTNLKDSILLWNEIKSENHVRNMNAWVHFTDSLVISKQLNNSSSKTLRMFPYKNLGSGTFDIDDLVIELIRE